QSSEAGCFLYCIEEYDTLSDILRRFDISIRDLKKYNKTCNLFSLKKGQLLNIKDTPGQTTRGYILKENETLWSVAKKFNISAISVLKANPNFMPQEIKQGIKIILPDQPI
ncbi:MAG: LysM peptidoglycan-binding domain-containing protein, partial [Christensenellales bacterium]